MKNFRIFVLILLVAIATPFVLHRRAWALHQAIPGSTASNSGLRIISPQPNEKIGQEYLTVQYQAVSATATSTPIYELRLDAREPVHTSDTSYTFDGVMPGSHQLLIQIVDANGTPVMGTLAEVKFLTTSPRIATTTPSEGTSSPPPLPQPLASDLPNGNGSLPLLSIIGFGILVGGVISALRTRPAHK